MSPPISSGRSTSFLLDSYAYFGASALLVLPMLHFLALLLSFSSFCLFPPKLTAFVLRQVSDRLLCSLATG